MEQTYTVTQQGITFTIKITVSDPKGMSDQQFELSCDRLITDGIGHFVSAEAAKR